MKRLPKSAILSRLAAFALVCACVAIAAVPPAKGSGPTVAVTRFTNDAGAPASYVDTLGAALYAAVDQSGKYTAVGGGPLEVKSPMGGDSLVTALDAAKRVGAEELIITNLINASGGSATYRLTAYRVNPIAFIRSQVFTQSSTAGAALTAGFVTNLSTLHAPRTAVGTIYSVTDGVKADMGAAAGFSLGQEFNVVRNSQKVAQAKITSIDLNSATIEISGAAAGYQPRIGDQLVGVGAQPAVPPAYHSPSNNTFTIIGILAATGAALFAIGHHGQPAGSAPAPSPTSSGFSTFGISNVSQSGTAPTETFTFTFNQPVNVSGFTFTNSTFVSVQVVRGGTTILPAGTPVTALGGPSPSFSAGNTVITINANSLLAGDSVIFSFTSAVKSAATGQSLIPTNVTFTASVGRHPAPQARAAHPAPVHGQGVVPAPQGGVPKPPPPPGGGKDPKNPK